MTNSFVVVVSKGDFLTGNFPWPSGSRHQMHVFLTFFWHPFFWTKDRHKRKAKRKVEMHLMDGNRILINDFRLSWSSRTYIWTFSDERCVQRLRHLDTYLSLLREYVQMGSKLPRLKNQCALLAGSHFPCIFGTSQLMAHWVFRKFPTHVS